MLFCLVCVWFGHPANHPVQVWTAVPSPLIPICKIVSTVAFLQALIVLQRKKFNRLLNDRRETDEEKYGPFENSIFVWCKSKESLHKNCFTIRYRKFASSHQYAAVDSFVQKNLELMAHQNMVLEVLSCWRC